MGEVIKRLLRLSLGLFLIAAASAVLLVTDKERQRNNLGGSESDRAENSRPSRPCKIGLISVADAKVVDDAYDGLRLGLKDAGLVDGRDFTINYKNAQGDIATLNSICDEMSGNDTELVVVVTTTALQAAIRKIERKPLVFALVLDPYTAGAGKSATDHRPNVTGVYLAFPYAEVASTIREVLPKARRVGTLYSPGELNSVLARDRFDEVLKKQGLTLMTKPVNAASEVSDAALELCRSKIDVLCQLSDGLTTTSFPAIARACEATRTPLFSLGSGQITMGAILTVGSDYQDNGRDAGLLAAEVIRGKNPASTPFRASTKVRRCVNLGTARRYSVAIPQDWLDKADLVLPASQRGQQPAGPK